MKILTLTTTKQAGQIIGYVKLTMIENNWHFGKLEYCNFPKVLLMLFREYEQLISNQVLSILDAVEIKIARWGLRINGIPIEDVQIMNGNDICFKISLQ